MNITTAFRGILNTIQEFPDGIADAMAEFTDGTYFVNP